MKTSLQTAPHYRWGNNCDGWHLFRDAGLSIIRERMSPSTAGLWHYHDTAQQVFFILSGQAFFETETETTEVGEGESIDLPPGVLHRISNKTTKDLEFLVISAPMAQEDRIEFIDYSPEYRSEVKMLNYEWLEKYFRVEPGDEKALSDPETEIIAKGGFIYFVRVNGVIVGTASLLQKTPAFLNWEKWRLRKRSKGKGSGKN